MSIERHWLESSINKEILKFLTVIISIVIKMTKLKPFEMLEKDVKRGDLVRFKLKNDSEVTLYFCGKSNGYKSPQAERLIFSSRSPIGLKEELFGSNCIVEVSSEDKLLFERPIFRYEILRRSKPLHNY
jgi:hypothetical protein